MTRNSAIETGTPDFTELKQRVTAFLCELNNPEITEIKRRCVAAADAMGLLSVGYGELKTPDIPEIKRRLAAWGARALPGVSFCEPDKPERLFCIPDERPLSQIDLAEPATYQVRLVDGQLAPLRRLIDTDLAERLRHKSAVEHGRKGARASAPARREAADKRHARWIAIAKTSFSYRTPNGAAVAIVKYLPDPKPGVSTVRRHLLENQGLWRRPKNT